MKDSYYALCYKNLTSMENMIDDRGLSRMVRFEEEMGHTKWVARLVERGKVKEKHFKLTAE